MLNRREISTDLCIIGGGIAGICAAISAARHGIKVVLMHERPMLGGNASSEIRMWICGAQGTNDRETGIIEEIMLENYYRNPTKNYYIWDTVLYDFVVREKNITLLLNCTCMDATVKNGSFAHGREIKIKKVSGYQLTTQMFIDVSASYYADCSGDSILAPLTGAKFRIGRESQSDFHEQTSLMQGDDKTMGLSCLVQGRETENSIRFTPPKWSAKLSDENFLNRNPDLYKTSENFWYLELGGNLDTISDTEKISSDLLKLAVGTWDYIKNSGSFNADKWELEFLGFLPGKRESRRMSGEITITQNDISSGKIFPDTVAYGGWPLDDHFPGGFYHRGVPNTNIPTPSPYCIPYRVLYSANVDNLFFAGRNISATHLALSSMRVMATCGLMGQAIGAACAIAAKNSLSPHDVYLSHITQLQNILLNDDCFLPPCTRAVSDNCRIASITNGSNALNDAHDRVHKIYNTEKCGESIKNGTPVTYNFNSLHYIDSVHIVFNSDITRDTIPGDKCERQHSMRANVLLNSPQMSMPATLCCDFVLTAETACDKITLLDIADNHKRFYHIPINKDVVSLTLIPKSNWGGTAQTDIFSFDFTE